MASGLSISASGIQSAFQRQDVSSNNISNISTPGFKSSDVNQTSNSAGGNSVESIETNNQQGSILRTDRDSDVAIDGDGYFVVNQDGEQQFTRSGSFGLDGEGRLVNQATGGIAQEVDNGETRNLKISPEEKNIEPRATDSVSIAGNLSSELEEGESRNLAIDLRNSQGGTRNVNFEFTKTDTNQYNVSAVDSETGNKALDAKLTFNASGEVENTTFNNTDNASDNFKGLSLSARSGTDPIRVESSSLDFSNITQQAGESSLEAPEISGRAPGQLESFSIGQDGSLTGQFSNGSRKNLGQLAVASFQNPGGLRESGGSSFSETSNSGEAEIGEPGTGSRGELITGALESSNTDLAEEIANQVTNQSALEANVGALGVKDEMMGTVLDLTG